MIDSHVLLGRMTGADGALPLLTLDEFFDGNEIEDSIAPNQWGYGRPPIAELHAVFQALAASDDVAWVRVLLHPDTPVDEDTLDEEGPAGEAMVICTTASTAQIEERIDTDGLGADGAIDGWAAPTESFCDVPPIPAGHSVLSVVWD